MSDLVVVLPGITGSVLRRDGQDVWAMTARGAASALLSLGRSLTTLELADDEADDGVTAPLLMPDLHLIPGLWKIDGYAGLLRWIIEHFEVKLGENLQPFPYDWRRDNRLTAARLKDNAERWLHAWRARSPDAKLVLVAHSMGGLVARYFLECLDGWRDTRALLSFGTPYRGSLNALEFTCNGMRKAVGPFTLLDLSRAVRSFPSVYQLLPIYPCVDAGLNTLLRPSEVSGLPNVDMTRVRAADEFHREIERAVTAHLDDDTYRRERYAMLPVVGTFQSTHCAATLRSGRLSVLEAHPQWGGDGDGTVPRVSATPIELERERGAMFAAQRHASLQGDAGVLVQLTGALSGQDLGMVRAGSPVGLDVEDLFAPEEPVAFRVRSEDPFVTLTAVLTRADTREEVARASLPGGQEWADVELPPQPSGTYRLAVTGDGGADVVSDVVVVVPAEPEEDGAWEPSPSRAASPTRSGLTPVAPPIGVTGPVIATDVRGPAPPAVGIETRSLDARMPAQVALGEAATLMARLGVGEPEQWQATLAPFAVPAEGLDVALELVTHPGFDCRSPTRAVVRVFPGTPSTWTGFDLRAIAEGVHVLRVVAMTGGTHLGDLAIETTVQQGISTGAETEHSAPAGDRRVDLGEVTIRVTAEHQPDGLAYRYVVIDHSGRYPSDATSGPLKQPLPQAVEALVQQFNVLARGQSPWDAATTLDLLRNHGIILWDELVPEALKELFWEIRDRVSKLTIVSAGDPMPWELLYPRGEGDRDAGFLVDQFPVARWLFDVRQEPAATLQARPAALVLGGGNGLGAAADDEARAIEDALAPAVPDHVHDLPTLLAMLDAGGARLLHFVGHNAFDAQSPVTSRYLLGGQPFEPAFLASRAGRLRAAAPLVFMNACRTDGQAPQYTVVDGWAQRFLTAGAGAFVGSLWEVRNASAATYAKTFYAAALGGRTLGEAAREARNAIRDVGGDPTWLAYSFYGDPSARMV